MLKVLLVDDEPALLEIGKAYLEREADITVTVCESPRQAIMELDHSRFDVIVCDYQMPEIDGIEFLEIVRKRNSRIPFILFTGKGREEVVIDALNKGADFYIKKGGDLASQFAELVHLIRQAAIKRDMEEALEYNARRFRSLIEESFDIFIIMSPIDTIKYISPSVKKILGYDPEELIGTNLSQFLHMDDVQIFEKSVERLSTKPGKIDQFDLRFRHKIGGWRVFEVTGKGSIDPKGRTEFILTARDVTELRRMMHALQQSEKRYRDVTESSPSGIYIFQDGKFKFVNRRMIEFLGYSEQELMNINYLELIHPEHRELMKTLTEKALRGEVQGLPLTVEFIVLNKKGEGRWVELIPAIIDFEGKPAILGNVIDITDRKLMEEELKEKTRELETLLDSIDTQIWCAIDPETYGPVNKARAEFLGMAKEDLKGKKIREVIPAETAEICIQGNKIAFEEKRIYKGVEWISTKKGKRKIAITKVPILDERGNVRMLVCTGHDITEESQGNILNPVLKRGSVKKNRRFSIIEGKEKN
ncbi:MAG: PAS domain S-box protein [Methanomassiliicoccales archaeon]|jgi:PAS domain S-box-containing protein|nr:PAS domain S-box protein [Methanomassiliicoccales archaeon]